MIHNIEIENKLTFAYTLLIQGVSQL